MSFGINESTIESLVNAFSESTRSVMNDIRIEHGLNTGNFQNGGAWDVRFNRLTQAALKNELVVITKRRCIWTFILLLNAETGSLFIFSKQKNLENVIKKFGKDSIHYFHAIVSLNSDPVEFESQQQGLFSMFPDEYEERRLMEAQKVLGEDYSSVSQVIFVTAQEEQGKFVKVEAKLFNRYFELMDIEDWTSYASIDQYSDIIVPSEKSIIEDSETNKVIPKVKKEVINRKKQFKKPIPNEKREKKQPKEEDNS